MATTTAGFVPAQAEPEDLARFGYRQELHRSVGSFSSFAAGFSFVSILTTVFQLFALGFGFGGAAFFWTWPLVFLGQYLVALNFSTLAARFPISGAIFQWSSRLGGQTLGWFTGWLMIIGQILTVATAAIALQAVLPAIWSGFQLVGGPGADAAPTSATGAANAVVLGVCLLVVTTVINVVGVRVMALVNSTGTVLEIVGVVAIVAALLFHAHRGPAILFTATGANLAPGSSVLSAWLASGLMAAYVMVGFDSAGELSEETTTPRRTTPRTILRALWVSGIGGGLLIMGALFAAPSLTDGNLATGGLPWVLNEVLGPVGGRILLADVAIAVFSCTLAVQTSGSRMMFSMARQKALPFHRALSMVSPRTGTPIVSSIVVGVLAALALAVNLHQTAIFTALASLCIAMIYLAYLGVTVPLLIARVREARLGLGTVEELDETGRPLFSLGRWGIPVNVLAVAYQVVAVVNLAWPRAAVYDLTGGTWWLQWSAVLFIGLCLVVGVLVHRRLHPHATRIPLAAVHARGQVEVAEPVADLA
ncbi:APC family permease [Raineyella fluvialis]|uniref:Amino acid permease n=1 Tax=Raineyella fluvialis TaxID=2662261 RepID=A0A5Q2FFR5_9ACTN|nr:APC family permease [Raineyella fluvialis]QGF23136.1 amino acid permease [Raineyella fluvialis]